MGELVHFPKKYTESKEAGPTTQGEICDADRLEQAAEREKSMRRHPSHISEFARPLLRLVEQDVLNPID